MDKKSDMNSEVYDLFYETFVETLDSFEMNCPVKKKHGRRINSIEI